MTLSTTFSHRLVDSVRACRSKRKEAALKMIPPSLSRPSSNFKLLTARLPCVRPACIRHFTVATHHNSHRAQAFPDVHHTKRLGSTESGITNIRALCLAPLPLKRILLHHLDKKNADEVDRHEEERTKISRGARMLDSNGKRSEERTLIAGTGSKNKDYDEATRITTGPDHDHHVVKIAPLRSPSRPRS
jgi:hypothetical protein